MDSRSKLCRACQKSAHEVDQMIPLFFKNRIFNEFATVADLFTKYTHLKIEPDEQIKPSLCIACYEVLANFHKFRKMCVASHFDFLKRKYAIVDCSVPLTPIVPVKLEKPLDIIDVQEFCMEFCEATMKTNEPTDNYKNNEPCSSFSGSNSKANSVDNFQRIQFTCEFCSGEFCTQFKLTDHRKRIHHISKKSTNFHCLICRKDFRNLDQMGKHVAVKHAVQDTGVTNSTIVKPCTFKCDHCSRDFRSRFALKVHQRQLTKAKNFVCSICGCKKDSQVNLNVHMNRHTKKRKYRCTECRRIFYEWSTLRSHLQKLHSVKQFSCQFCKENFYTAKSLDEHWCMQQQQEPDVLEWENQPELGEQIAQAEADEHIVSSDSSDVMIIETIKDEFSD